MLGTLSPLDGKPRTCLAFAADSYERAVDFSAIQRMDQHRPLTAEVDAQMNPEMSLAELAEDAHEIGYPEPTGKG